MLTKCANPACFASSVISTKESYSQLSRRVIRRQSGWLLTLSLRARLIVSNIFGSARPVVVL